MRGRRFFNGMGQLFSTMGSAMAVSAAINERRRPLDTDLTRLGIDPQSFSRLNRR